MAKPCATDSTAAAIANSTERCTPSRLSRLQHHPETRAYAARRTTEGKTRRDIKRCLKRAIAREIYPLLEAHAKAEKKINQAA